MKTWIKQKLLLDHLEAQFTLDWYGIHGVRHWGRVLKNGLLIAQREDSVRTDVVKLFALLHDHARLDDDRDPNHGFRAVESAHRLRGTFFEIDNHGMNLLTAAMRYHSDGRTEADITIQVCWDADRLDLGRVGMVPHPQYLCTKTAKDPAFLLAAYERSRRIAL